MAKIISILNFKCGVGKTTTCINLGTALWMQGYKVLLVDSDSQANLTRHMDFDASAGDPTLYNWMNDASINPPVYQRYDGLFYIPAGRNLLDIEAAMITKMNREHILDERLQIVSDFFDYILIDCSPKEGLLNTNAMTASDGVIIPVECSTYAIDGLVVIENGINDVKKYLNPKLEIMGMVITRYNKQLRISRSIINSLEKQYPGLVFDNKISMCVKIQESPFYNQSVFEFKPLPSAAEEYFRLSEEIIGVKHNRNWEKLVAKFEN